MFLWRNNKKYQQFLIVEKTFQELWYFRMYSASKLNGASGTTYSSYRWLRWFSQMRVWLEIRRSRIWSLQGPATFFHGDWSWNIFDGHSLPSHDFCTTKWRGDIGFAPYVNMYVHNIRAYIYQWILIHIHVWYDNISSKFNFKVAGLKVKVTVAIFRDSNPCIYQWILIYLHTIVGYL